MQYHSGLSKIFGDRNGRQAEQEELLKKYNKEDHQKNFCYKTTLSKILIVFAGPLANSLPAILIFALIYMFVGKDFTPAQINDVQRSPHILLV